MPRSLVDEGAQMNNPAYVERDREYQRAYYLKNREKKLAYARAQRPMSPRRPTTLAERAEAKKKYMATYYAERQAAFLLKSKIACLQVVSGKKKPTCCKCDCDDIRVLTINHQNGNGRQDVGGYTTNQDFRRAILDGRRSVADLDVRCFNCNIRYEYERGRWRLPKNWEEILNLTCGD